MCEFVLSSTRLLVLMWFKEFYPRCNCKCVLLCSNDWKSYEVYMNNNWNIITFDISHYSLDNSQESSVFSSRDDSIPTICIIVAIKSKFVLWMIYTTCIRTIHDFLNFQINRLNVHVSGIFIFKNFIYRYLFGKRLTICFIVKNWKNGKRISRILVSRFCVIKCCSSNIYTILRYISVLGFSTIIYSENTREDSVTN